MLTVAVIGAGRMGRIRTTAALNLGARVSVICDPLSDRADSLVRETEGATVLTDYRQLPWDRLDAIFICTPPAVRSQIALDAIEAKVPVFMEKPIGLCAEDADVLLVALERSPVVTAVGYMNRYRASVQQLRRELQDKNILGVVVNWVGGRYNVAWWADPDQSGGPVNEQATHVIDLCRYLVGEVSAVQALFSDNTAGASTESAVLNLSFANGALGSVLYSCQAQEKMISFRVLTDHREFRLEGWELNFGEARTPQAHKNRVFEIETDAFLQTILRATGCGSVDQAMRSSASTVLADLPDAVATQRVVDMALRAARDRRVWAL